jgi:hypothetical protein
MASHFLLELVVTIGIFRIVAVVKTNDAIHKFCQMVVLGIFLNHRSD